jgi:hypothetical protein
MNLPYPWLPSVVDVSLFRIGNFVILNVPGEFTTMAGRRLRAAVREAVEEAWGKDVQVRAWVWALGILSCMCGDKWQQVH